MHGVSPFTPERWALAVERYATGDLDQLVADLNALPGTPINRDNLRQFANNQGLKRTQRGILSKEQQALLRAEYPTADNDILLAKINAIPGGTITKRQLVGWAVHHNVGKESYHKSELFPPERQEIIRRDFPTHRLVADILAECNTLPGPVVTDDQLRCWTKTNKIHRPPRLKRPVEKRPPSNSSPFTPERIEIVRLRYAGSAALTQEVVDEINATAGPQINALQLRKWAARNGFNRPSDAVSVASARRWNERADVRVMPRIHRSTWEPSAPPKPKPRAPNAPRQPEAVEERIVRMWGATLGLPLDMRGDAEAVSRAYRRHEDPTHPGFRIRNRNLMTDSRLSPFKERG